MPTPIPLVNPHWYRSNLYLAGVYKQHIQFKHSTVSMRFITTSEIRPLPPVIHFLWAAYDTLLTINFQSKRIEQIETDDRFQRFTHLHILMCCCAFHKLFVETIFLREPGYIISEAIIHWIHCRTDTTRTHYMHTLSRALIKSTTHPPALAYNWRALYLLVHHTF